jgi:hypothetical protein
MKQEAQYSVIDGERKTVAVKLFDHDNLAIGLMM